MDSFYNPVRIAPEPISIEKIISGNADAAIEVTVISDEREFGVSQMKYQQLNSNPNFQQPYLPMKYKNFQAHCVKKQVRFQNPGLRKQFYGDSPLNREQYVEKVSKAICSIPNEQSTDKQSNKQKPFEEIYMANILDRKLDLSLVDVSQDTSDSILHSGSEMNQISRKPQANDELTENKENRMPETYKDFLEANKNILVMEHEGNDSVTDIFNYRKAKRDLLLKPHKMSKNEPINKPQKTENLFRNESEIYKASEVNFNFSKKKCECETQTCFEDLGYSQNKSKDVCIPSNTDLLKIIEQQNEQLHLLQRQVAMLLDKDRHFPKPVLADSEKLKYDSKIYNSITATQNNRFLQENTVIQQQAEIFQDSQRKWGMSKLSINLTTKSFEVPIRTQQRQNFVNMEPKIQEMPESSASRVYNSEPSLEIEKRLEVQELCPSPQPSININMNEYDSSDNEESTSEVGPTYYNELMEQVNNILRTANVGTERMSDKENKMLVEVKEATLKRLKNIGITLGPTEDFDEIAKEINEHRPQSQTSCSVKQLLMKYLPLDQLERQNEPNSGPSTGIISPRPEFSLASLEYMKKYNIISSKQNVPEVNLLPKLIRNEGVGSNKKILDLTALKMQPKFL